MAKKAIFREKGQKRHFLAKIPKNRDFRGFWAPGGPWPGPAGGGFTSTPPRGPGTGVPRPRGPGRALDRVPGLRDQDLDPGRGPGTGPGRGFYINPSRRGPAVPRGGPGSPPGPRDREYGPFGPGTPKTPIFGGNGEKPPKWGFPGQDPKKTLFGNRGAGPGGPDATQRRRRGSPLGARGHPSPSGGGP